VKLSLEERNSYTVADLALVDLDESLAAVESLRGVVGSAGLHDRARATDSTDRTARTSATPTPRRKKGGSTASLWMSIVTPSNFHETMPASWSSTNAPRKFSPHARRSSTVSLSGGIVSEPISCASTRYERR